MSIWLFLTAAPVIFITGLLSIPLKFSARGYLKTEKRRLNARVSWGWGLLVVAFEIINNKSSFGVRLAGIKLPALRKKTGVPKDSGEPVTKEKKTGQRKKSGFDAQILRTALSRELLVTLLAYLRNVFKSLTLRLKVSGIYGTPDPALTGLLAGIIAILNAGQVRLDVDADFTGTNLDLKGEASGRIVPIVLIWLSLRLILTKPLRKIWWTSLRKNLRKSKGIN